MVQGWTVHPLGSAPDWRRDSGHVTASKKHRLSVSVTGAFQPPAGFSRTPEVRLESEKESLLTARIAGVVDEAPRRTS